MPPEGEFRVPALLVAGAASGQGKTWVTCALARLHAREGRRVRVLKVGPDFLDPAWLAFASGAPVFALDPGFAGWDAAHDVLRRAAEEADIVLVEGMMGLFDGEHSGARIAAAFGLPVALVVDVWAMAETFGAIVHGLATYRDDLRVVQVVANRVASAGHAQMLRDSLVPFRPLTTIERHPNTSVGERHLGLVDPREHEGAARALEAAADALLGTPLAMLPPLVAIAGARGAVDAPRDVLRGRRIGVARDEAFRFVYAENLDLLARAGAEFAFFSPIADTRLRDIDAVYLPGGYPELHATELASNGPMRADMRRFVDSGAPVLAECGGMMWLADTLVDVDGRAFPMVGALSGTVTMHRLTQAIAHHAVGVGESRLAGHAFHCSTFDSSEVPKIRTTASRGPASEPIYVRGGLVASYVHWYFPSNPARFVDFFRGIPLFR